MESDDGEPNGMPLDFGGWLELHILYNAVCFCLYHHACPSHIGSVARHLASCIPLNSGRFAFRLPPSPSAPPDPI